MGTLPLKIASLMMILMMLSQASARIRNCLDQKNEHNSASGVYTIYPDDNAPMAGIEVYCDMTTDGGGWTVIQRRDNYYPRESFYKTWMEYAVGFGDVKREFWLGLDNIHALTEQTSYKIRFDMKDFLHNSRYAKYDFFYVYDRANYYKMEINSYSGNAGDAMTYANGMYFSTKDKDLDATSSDCAEIYDGGWWYRSCYRTNPNGIYYTYQTSTGTSIKWSPFTNYNLRFMEIKIKPAD